MMKNILEFPGCRNTLLVKYSLTLLTDHHHYHIIILEL